MQYWRMPKNTPQKRVDLFADALEKAMQTPELLNWLRDVQSEPTFVRGEALDQRIAKLEEQVATVNLREAVGMPNLPGMALGAVFLLCVVIGIRSLRDPGAVSRQGAGTSRHLLAVACGIVVVMYVFALAVDSSTWWAGFPLLTGMFVLAMGMLLAQDRRRAAVWIVALALALAIGLSLLATQVFEVDLP